MPELVFESEAKLREFVSELPTISNDEAIQMAYMRMRLDGQAHPFAEMCAFRTPPGTKNTDRAFQENQISRYTGKEPWMKQAVRKYKAATGHDIPKGAMYISQLAKEPNDPRAWVTDLGDVKRRLRELGHGCDDLGIAPVEMEPIRVKYDEALIQERMRKAVAKPENIGKNATDIREAIIEKHSYSGAG
jgi:hypothetical protein